MRFEWDKDKEKQNIKKHEISFDEAVTVFYDPLSVTFADPDHSIDEERFITVGYSSQGRLFIVSHTENGKRRCDTNCQCTFCNCCREEKT